MPDLLRIALPDFERLPQIEVWFSGAGLPLSNLRRPGIHKGGDPWDCGLEIECFSVAHLDVGTYVERGIAQVGIMRSECIMQTKCQVWAPYTLPFGHYPIVLAAPAGETLKRLTRKPVLRLATPFPDFVSSWFTERGMQVEIVPVADRPDTAVLLGLADAFVGIIDENHELVDQGFRVIDLLGHSELKLIANDACGPRRRLAIRKIISVLASAECAPTPTVSIPYEGEDDF